MLTVINDNPDVSCRISLQLELADKAVSSAGAGDMPLSRRQILVAGSATTALGLLNGCGRAGKGDYDNAVATQRAKLPVEPDFQDLVRYATLAPNSHNTQPWRFRDGGTAIEILPDLKRRCPVVDPDDHHLFVSLGCAAENLVIAGNARGRAAEAQITSSGKESSILVAMAKGAISDQHLCDAIPLRQSTRSNYTGEPLTIAELQLLERAAAMPGVDVLMITDRTKMGGVLDYVIEANSHQCDDPAFVRELKHWIRFNPGSALETHDGLFTGCTGNPTAPTWLGNAMFERLFSKESENDKYADHMRTSAGLAIFIADAENEQGWITVGRSFQRFALQATAMGLRHAHLNMPVEVASVRSRFTDWLGINGKRPDLVIRFGKSAALPMSLRRPVNEVVLA